MLHLHSLSSHVAIRNPRLCSHHSLSSQDSIRTGSKYFEQKNFTSRPTSGSSFAPQSPGGGVTLPPKVFVRHSIYNGKAALTVEPRAPDFASLDVRLLEAFRGHSKFLRMVLCCFSLLLQQLFANMIGAENSDEGKVREVLKVEPLPDGSGHFFNLSVQNKLLNMDESIYIPITKAEYTVLVSAFNVSDNDSLKVI